ncbi:hypothetical protein GDO78_020660 [Eleutherodactylus coqui]|uniref:Lysosomal-trafficking regulator n=1 Tax=Eleutherodactylus coqui TaxID=57060 RepID=A0A8J6EMS2_ELECQ|nr:hypothetical protein GDO78_020660 [Eleutherodactylus coqui]
MNAYCNDIAREFLTDVNKLCSADGEIRDDEEEENHVTVLVEYLMNGRGHLLLTTLNKTVDQSLTCREELMTLILSLLPLVWKIPVEEKGKESCAASETLQIPHKRIETDGTSLLNFPHSLNTLLQHKPRRQHKSICRHSLKDDQRSLSSSDSETTVQEQSSSSMKQRKPFGKPVPTYIRDSKVAEKSSQQQKVELKPKFETAFSEMSTQMNLPETASIPNKESSPFHLCQILLSLLEKVCKFDIMLNHSSALSVCVIPALTEFISEIGEYYAPGIGTLVKGWTEETVALVQRMLLHTVLSLLSVDISEKDFMPDNLRNNLIDLLRTALKLKSYSNKNLDSLQKLSQDGVENINLCSCQHQVFFIPDLLEGVFQIMLSCLKYAAPNHLYFSQCIELLHDFIQYSGFDLFENAILQMESLSQQCEDLHSQASEYVLILISSVLKIVSLIKKVKSEQLHQSMCTRKRHRRCEFSHFMHHHRDLSGLPISLFKNDNFEESTSEEIHYPERSCCIAICSHRCLRLLQKVSVTTTCLQILSGTQNAGICCCMDPLSVITPLLYAFKVPALKNVQHHILSILANFLLNQLGGGKISSVLKQASCNMCVMDNDHLTELQETFQGRTDSVPVTGLCSMPYRLQGVLPCGGYEDVMWKWDSLEAYQELVFSNDLQISLYISSHICHLIQEGNAVIQWKLYTLIFNGILQRGVEMVHHCQQSGISTLSSQPDSSQKSCLLEVLKVYLKSLPELLKSRVVREAFLNLNGLNQVTELNYLDPLRWFCLKVFETLICFGDQQTELSALTTDISSNDANTSDSGHLLKPHEGIHVSQSLSKFYGVLKDACPKKKKDSDQKINTINLFLCMAFLSVSKDAESDLESVNEEDTSGYDSTASEPLSILPKLNAESLFLPSPEHIHLAADIWSMCYWLFLKSSMFQKQFHKIGGFDLCYKLVHMMINNFPSFEDFSSLTVKLSHSQTLNPFLEENSGLECHEKGETLIRSQDDMCHQLELPDSSENTSSLLSTLKTDAQNWSSGAGKLFEALLSICLHSARNSQLKLDLETSQNIPVQHVMLEIQELLAHSRILETKLAPHIFDSLLRVAVSNFPVQKTEELVLQHGDTAEEPDESYSCKLNICGVEEGYEADSESNPEDVSEDDECHEVLIDILVTLMGHSLNSDELALLLRFFLENTLPSEMLIKGILKITEASTGMIPLKHLTFPMQQNLIGTSGVAQKFPGLCRRAKIWQNKDFSCDHLLSPWYNAPIHIPLVGQNCWPHMSDGFSLTLWLKLECVQELEGLTRGKQTKKKNKFPFQAQSTGDESKWISLAQVETQENILHPGNWQHLVFTCKEVFESKNKVCSKIMLWVSGQRTTEITLEYNPPRKGSLSSDCNRTFCMIGHHVSTQEDSIPSGGQLCLGNLLLFNGPVLGIDEAFHLYCRGPDFTSLMTCKHGNVVIDHCKYISKEILQNEKVYDFLMKNKEIDLASLAENLAVVYDMENPATYTIYEPVIRMKGSLKTTSTQRPFSTKEVTSKSLDLQALKTLKPCYEKNIHSVLHEIGGIGSIVFLFARIVEISSCEETQSLGLQIILSLIKYNQQRIQESENCDIYPMIHQVLTQPKCTVGFHMLKTILKGCTGDWLLSTSENDNFCLNYETTAVIQDVRLLEHLLLDWKIWAKAEVGVWEALMSSLEILIRDTHPYKLFNIQQLLKAKVVHHFLLACQVLQEHREGYITSIPQEVCGSYIKIIEEVLGSPPELDLLKLIFSFLLAVHPPTNTFVCHNPNNFFFSLHIDDKIFQEKLKFVINQRYSSIGGQSTISPVFSSKGEETSAFSSQQHLDDSEISRPRSKSLPTSPSSPGVQPERLGGSHSKSIADLTDCKQAMEIEACKSDHRLEVLKTEEDPNVSSCESAQTVWESGMLPDFITVTELPKEDLEQCAVNDGSGTLTSQEGVGEDTVVRRPDKLKGIYSPKKGQGNVASISLAFPSNRSIPSTSWADVPEKKKSEEWGSFSLSPVFGFGHRDSINMEERSVDECMHLVCCGLYRLLCGVLITMPDIMVADVFNEIIHADVLIVLVNHPSPHIQQGVLKLLNAYFYRASKEEKEAFLKKSGFSLLANQLYLHQGSQEVLESLLEMFFGRHIGLNEEFDVEEIKTANVFRKWCIIPVLGLIENSLHDASLLHNSFCLLLQIINSCSKVADMLLDSGLLYALCNTLATLCGIETSVSPDEYILLACDLQQLLIAVTIHSCSSSGSQYFRIVEDLIVILGYLNESKNEKLQNMAVVMQFKILHSAVEFIKTTSNQDTQAVSATIHFTQTSHAKYYKRKNTAGTQRLSFAQSDPLLMTMRSFASSELTELMHRRMSQENPIRASESEFVQRLQRLTVLAVNRLIYQAGRCGHQGGTLLHIWLNCPGIFSQINKISWNSLKLPLEEHGPKMALYLFELMYNHKDDLTKEDQTMGALLMSALKESGYKCIPPNAPLKTDLLKASQEEQKKYEKEELANKGAWKKTVVNNQQKLFQRLESKLKEISKIAGDITQSVSLSQGMERKAVIQHIRNMYKVDLSASRHWQELVQQMTHDRAVWYDPASYSTSFQLDPTEGPNRERRRLQKCYLTIPNKYILRDRQRPEESIKPPLSYFFEDKTHSSLSSTVKEKAASELIRVNRRCVNVAPSRETIGELLLGKTGMYFVEDSSGDTVESNPLLGESEPASFSWTYEEIKEVHKRWWQLRDNAVEIFLTNGRTLLLAFDNTKVRDDVYQKILTNDLPNLLEYGNITALTQLWCSGQITNFEYLTHLNKHAGRSFNDLMQYPVFPFILSDYTSETLDLSSTLIYRNLVKPIAVQSKEKEDRYIDNYKYLEDEYCKADREDDPMPPVQPYHYGSHYSNSGTVLHFLVRLPPFTKMFLAYQDQSFDIPDRTFHSMNTTWRLSSYESMTDVKELIPEFFYLPEFLVNREGFDFGVRQNGERVNHVNLPPWARNDPRLFILIHRQALESDYVSQAICHWIDLVFGYKQKGRAAVQAINVFHPATYFGMDVSAVEDPVQRRALETMIKTYGQTPRQLFHSAHVSRSGSKLLMEGELPAAMGLLVQFAFRENKENSKESTYPSPLPWIRGLKWGEYVGSPSAPDPTVCFSQPHGERFGSLQALPTRAICGLSKNFCLMMSYSKEKGVRSMHSTDIQWSAILSWGYPDNILRLKSKQSEPPVNFIQCSELNQVTSCAWVPDSCQLYTGSKCGVITVYLNRYIPIFDRCCIFWRLCYVQSLTGHKSPVTAVSASETTGDIATVCDSVGGGSDLRLWTVNGDLIGHVHCRERVSCVAFSNQPEGVSVNVVAGGLENGIVRLWSTWDLKPVREITFPKSNKPIVSLTFSCDGHHLYTANSEGTVIGWCRKDQQRLKLPMFYSFLSNYAAC